MEDRPQTLLEKSGFYPNLPEISEAALLLIDFQKEYDSGGLPLPDFAQATQNAALLLETFRAASSPIFHIVHHGRPGGTLFDPDSPNSDITPALAPKEREEVIIKGLPNAFAKTDLAERIRASGRSHLVVAGFATHMCVSASVRAALDLGFTTTVIGDACATRALPDPQSEGIIDAKTLHHAALAALADRFAQVSSTKDLLSRDPTST